MNGAFDRLRRIAGRAHPTWLGDVLGGFALPGLAAAGTLGVIGVLVGLQCGGLDRCLAPAAPAAITTVDPPDAAAVPVDEPRLAPDTVATVAEPAPSPEVEPRSRQIDAVIGDTFAAIRADDAGWLAGAHSAKVEEAAATTEVVAATGPVPKATAAGAPRGASIPTRNSAAGEAAVAAIAALEQPVKPVPRPEPLAVTAFADTPADTPPSVAAAARKQLAEVAARTPAVPAETRPADTAAAVKVADFASGETRTVGGAGVNVRSGPGKSSGKLFALASGEKVKVGENQHGWLKITDDQGRTGWVYKTYLQ